MSEVKYSRLAVAPKKRWTVRKSDLVKMLMVMDRYKVDSVTIRTEPDYFNWEIDAPKRK